ncbi:MAG: hypothetical protein KatS3mg096_795 [Candidatus Parcubacteria bacterium]|nr:MAG: hypothetical protein KatS3mg096_795 [Candidatus Parcubacteria bacterium]
MKNSLFILFAIFFIGFLVGVFSVYMAFDRAYKEIQIQYDNCQIQSLLEKMDVLKDVYEK